MNRGRVDYASGKAGAEGKSVGRKEDEQKLDKRNTVRKYDIEGIVDFLDAISGNVMKI